VCERGNRWTVSGTLNYLEFYPEASQKCACRKLSFLYLKRIDILGREFAGKKRDGRVFYLWNVFCVREKIGKATSFGDIMVILPNKKMFDAAGAGKRAAEQARSGLKAQFLANMSHGNSQPLKCPIMVMPSSIGKTIKLTGVHERVFYSIATLAIVVWTGSNDYFRHARIEFCGRLVVAWAKNQSV